MLGRTVGHARVHALWRCSHPPRRTKRVWLPNVQSKRLFSDALGGQVKVKVTTYVLRCIDKAGGLDNYLLTVRALLWHEPRIAAGASAASGCWLVR